MLKQGAPDVEGEGGGMEEAWLLVACGKLAFCRLLFVVVV